MLNLFVKSLQSIALLACLSFPVLQLRAVAEPVFNSSEPEILPETSRYLCPANLGKAIEAVIGRPLWKRSRWGILIQTLNSDLPLYAFDAQRYFIPASNVKLLITAAALLELGSQFRIRTSVYGSGDIPNLSSLRVVGRGDPSLTTSGLKYLAYQLKRQGVQRVSHLIVEDGYFSDGGIDPTWEWSDVHADYGTSVNSLILNENAVTLKLLPQQLGQPLKLDWSDAIAARQWQVKNLAVTSAKGALYSVKIARRLAEPILEIKGDLAIDSQPDVWGLAIADPNKYFLESFRQILMAEGIVVDSVALGNTPQFPLSERELAAIESPPLWVLLNRTNQDSNNLVAETLLRMLATRANNRSGIDALEQTLTRLGVDPESYVIADGSGLSRHNSVTPEAIVRTLKLMAQTPEAEYYRNSLAVAGTSGTLKSRFKDRAIRGNLQGKTGTLSGVAALSGYLNVPNYQPLVFSIILNQSDRSGSIARQTIDEIILLLENLRECRS